MLVSGLRGLFLFIGGFFFFFSCTQSKSPLHGQLSASWMRTCLNTKDQRAEPALPSFSKKYSCLSLLSIMALVSMTWLLMKMVCILWTQNADRSCFTALLSQGIYPAGTWAVSMKLQAEGVER